MDDPGQWILCSEWNVLLMEWSRNVGTDQEVVLDGAPEHDPGVFNGGFDQFD